MANKNEISYSRSEFKDPKTGDYRYQVGTRTFKAKAQAKAYYDELVLKQEKEDEPTKPGVEKARRERLEAQAPGYAGSYEAIEDSSKAYQHLGPEFRPTHITRKKVLGLEDKTRKEADIEGREKDIRLLKSKINIRKKAKERYDAITDEELMTATEKAKKASLGAEIEGFENEVKELEENLKGFRGNVIMEDSKNPGTYYRYIGGSKKKASSWEKVNIDAL